MTSNPRQRTCFSFSMPPETFNKPFEFLLDITNRLHSSVRVHCDRSQKTSQRVKNNSYATRLHFVLYPLWRHTYGKCNQTYFSPKTKIILLLFIYQMSFFAEQLYLVLALRVCFLLCSWYRLVKNLVEWKTFSFIWKSLYILFSQFNNFTICLQFVAKSGWHCSFVAVGSHWEINFIIYIFIYFKSFATFRLLQTWMRQQFT